MSEVPSPIEVTNGYQVAALGLLLAAFVVIPAVINYLMNRPVKKTLTTNNGGSTMKDQLDRIESKVDGVSDRVTVLEGGGAITEESFDVPNV